MLAVLKIIAPGLENFNNSQKFYIMSFVLGLNRNQLSKKIGY